jgi:hypothetical protein
MAGLVNRSHETIWASLSPRSEINFRANSKSPFQWTFAILSLLERTLAVSQEINFLAVGASQPELWRKRHRLTQFSRKIEVILWVLRQNC